MVPSLVRYHSFFGSHRQPIDIPPVVANKCVPAHFHSSDRRSGVDSMTPADRRPEQSATHIFDKEVPAVARCGVPRGNVGEVGDARALHSKDIH